MPRMLGRFQTPGCCPGARAGWRRTRRMYGPDCSGAGSDTRWRKRQERREFARSLLPEGELSAPGDDLSDCWHGCNGDCLGYAGPSECGYACHPGLLHEEV